MWSRLARGAFLALLAVMVAAWAVSIVKVSQVEPNYDPTEYWLA